MSEIVRERNKTVDIIRAFAIIMVVLGHCISTSTTEFESSFLFSFIWSLQMPLFFILSGYLDKYSKPINNIKDLEIRLLKKTLAYMVPFVVWTFAIIGLVFQQTGFFDIKYLIYHMDDGYWFLFVLLIISISFYVFSFVANKLMKNNSKINYIVFSIFLFALFTALLFILGYFVSFNLLCIKLIIYYIPFYSLGFIFGKATPYLNKFKNLNLIENIVAFICCLTWLFLIIKYNFYSMEESPINIILRYVASTCGCISFCWAIFTVCPFIKENMMNKIVWIGQHTLEIYMMHYLLLGKFKITDAFTFSSLNGILVVIFNFVIVFGLSVLLIWIIDKDKMAKKVLFWK